MDSCTFCGSDQVAAAFQRDIRVFLKCRECGAYTVQNPPVVESWDAYEEASFLTALKKCWGKSLTSKSGMSSRAI